MTPADGRSAMPVTTQEADLAKDSMLGDRFLLRFSEDTLRHRPLWIRLIIEFLGHLHLGDRRGRFGRHQPLRGHRPESPAARPR